MFGEVFSQVLRDGFENTDMGDTAGMLFKSMAEDLVGTSEYTDELAQGYIKQIKALLDAGFNSNEIKEYMTGGLEAFQDRIASTWGDTWENMVDEVVQWADVADDIGWMKFVNDLHDSGVEIQQIDAILSQSTGFEDFANRIKEAGIALPTVNEELGETEEIVTTMSKLATSVNSITGNIDTIKKVQSAVASKDAIDTKDLMEVLEIAPQLWAVLGDAEAFANGLTGAMQTQTAAMEELVRSYLMNSEEIVKSSPFAGDMQV